MPETVNTVVAKLIDEVTPAAEKMQESFGKSMDELSVQIAGFKNELQGVEGCVPSFDSAVSVLQQLGETSFTAGEFLASLGETAAETGNAYMEMGVLAVESLTEVMANSEEILGGVGEFFNQFKEDSLSSAVGFSSAVSNIGAQFVAQAKSQVDAQRKSDIEKVKNSTMSEEDKQKAIDEINKKAEAEKKKLAMTEKTIAISKAAINTALAVGNALTTTPFPAGLVMAGVAAAMGAAQVAAISAQSFEQGGIVPGTSFTGDQIAARVNSGEMILNRSQQSQLFAMANGGGGSGGGTVSMGGDTIVINGNADENTVEQIRQTKQRQMEEMKELLKEMKYHGQLEL